MTPRRRATLLVLLALVARLGIALVTQCISSDGPEYVQVAARWADGEFRAALEHPYHPLYPGLMALAHAAIADWEAAGMIVSALLGGLAVLPLWLFSRRAFGEHAATAAALLYAVHPYAVELSAAVLTTGTYLFFALWAMDLADRAVRGGSAGWTFAAGVAAGGAYLTRMDGILLFPVVGGVVAVALLQARREAGFARRFALHAGALLAAFFVVAFPYLLSLREINGHWVLTGKMTAGQMRPMVADELWEDQTILTDHQKRQQDWFATPVATRVPLAVGRLAYETARALHPVPLFLLALGVWVWLRRPGGDRWRAGGSLWLYPLLMLAALLYFSVIAGRESKRYTVPIAAMLLGGAGAGTVALAEAIDRRRKRAGPGEEPAHAVVVEPVPATGGDRGAASDRTPTAEAAPPSFRWVLGAVVAILATFMLRVPGKEKAGERLAGLWIREHAAGAAPRILTRMDRVSFYAAGERLALTSTQRLTGDLLLRRIEAEGAEFVVVDYHIDRVFPEFDAWMEKTGKQRLRLVYQTSKLTVRPDRKDVILVYEVVPRH